MDDFFETLKGHANTAKESAIKIGKQVYEKTSNVVSQTKLNFAINETESKVKDVYCEMGKLVYADYISNGGTTEEFEELCLKADDLISEIESLREKVAELKESVKCKKCNAYNKDGDVYCSKCGSKLYDEEAVETEASQEEVADETEEKPVKKVVTIKAKRPQTVED